MVWIAIGGGALLLGLGLLRVFATASVTAVRQIGLWFVGGIAAVVFVLLLVTGRGGQMIWLLAVAGPLGWRRWQAWRANRRFRQPPGTPAGASDVRTATLSMTLDHATGRMAGEVLAGRFAGRGLGELSVDELRALLAECRAGDPESVPLLEAWLDREAPDWRATDDAGPAAGRPGPMTREEALAVLGLAAGADPAAIRAAHRRLMQAAHPDHGGSDWLAARVNEARDVLLS